MGGGGGRRGGGGGVGTLSRFFQLHTSKASVKPMFSKKPMVSKHED